MKSGAIASYENDFTIFAPCKLGAIKICLGMNKFSMINISDKQDTMRIALAMGTIHVGAQAFELIQNNKLPKGDVLALANIAGIQGAKQATNIMPLCHPLPINHIGIEIELNQENHSITIYCTAATFGKTGVEMEALSGVNAALLNIWDLSKMINPNLLMSDIKLLAKIGGKSGLWINENGICDKAKSIIEAWQ
jgi:cyclic pyranopterin monophosphate synthase